MVRRYRKRVVHKNGRKQRRPVKPHVSTVPEPVLSFKDVNDVGELFVGSSFPVQSHVDALRSSPEEYICKFTELLKCGVTLNGAVKSRAFASSWICREYKLTEQLLQPEVMSVAEVLKALKILDSGRRIRVVQKQITVLEARLEKYPTSKRIPRKISTCKTTIHNLKKDENSGSVSGALCRRIRKWCKTFQPFQLEYYILSFPYKPWKELADIIHCSPNDFQVPYFLSWAIGEETVIPTDSFVGIVKNLKSSSTREDIQRAYDLFPDRMRTSFNFLRKQLGLMDGLATDEVRGELARLGPLHEVIWWYEELKKCPAVDNIILHRLQQGEELDANATRTGYAKLMERIFLFNKPNGAGAELSLKLQQVAEKQLSKVKENFEKMRGDSARSKIVIMGDASSSMQVCINVGSIISSLLAVLMDAEFVLFNTKKFLPPLQPRSVSDVLRVVETTHANGCTSPAAPLYDMYRNKQAADLIIMVTDEEENTNAGGFKFAPLFKKYREEIAPSCKLWLISFLSNVHVKHAQMERDLLDEGLGECFKQFRMDRRPDLTKFDSLLGMLAVDVR